MQFKVLCVDDNPKHQLLVAEMLSGLNLQISFASNGQEGVMKWISWEPDLVLMDIEMPVMNGYQAILEIRFVEMKEKLSRTPVVFLSSHAEKLARNPRIKRAADGVLSKPCTPDELIVTVTEFMPPASLFASVS